MGKKIIELAYVNIKLAYSLSTPLKDLLNMLRSNSSFTDARKVLVEQIDKRIEELEDDRSLDWESSDESGNKSPYIITA